MASTAYDTELWRTLKETLQRIGQKISAAHADDVDKQARFPAESLAALKENKLLGAYVPRDLGGLGCSLIELAAMCESLGQHCSATAMVLAMHHIQVASLVRHPSQEFSRRYLSDLVKDQRLIASVTSEMGVGGDMRSSVCAIEQGPDSFSLRKEATTISYGEHADDLLITARRNPDAPASDQSLVLLLKGQFTLERKGTWDTVGMRGTCSPGFLMMGKAHPEQILETPFADIAGLTMVPVSHVLWASVWLGIATNAVLKAKQFVREQARRMPGTVPPTASRLAELWNALELMRNNVHYAATEVNALFASPQGAQAMSTLGFALKMNNLKVSASQAVPQIVHAALLICGIAGYKNDSKFGLGRQLRDAHSAALMVGNDRIFATNASLLLVHKDE